MISQFNQDGKYFAYISTDGKLKIWDTLANRLDQEFTPDYHLTSPCTCLNFINAEHFKNKASPSPKKKKRKISDANISANVVLGTSSGLLIIYSLAKGDIDYTLDSKTSQSVNCLSNSTNVLYAGIDQSVFMWDLDQRKLLDKWKVGNERIVAILAIPDTNNILTTSKSIKMWNVDKKELLKTFTGHSSEISFLHFIPSENECGYVISASRGDRILNCWNLGEEDKNAAASFLMEDIVHNISINLSSDCSFNLAVTVRSGVVHVYKHTLNGKRNKPIKPNLTIQVVSYAGAKNEDVVPLRILGAMYREFEVIGIGYGTENILTFENLTISNYKKMECLVRNDPTKITIKNQEQSTKTLTPTVNNDVHYLTPRQSSVSTTKRKNDLQTEVPMEQRLENLTLSVLEDKSKVPKGDNVVQLLVQGLHSKDKNILRTVLYKKDENVIKNTVKRLPVTALVPLIQELNSLVQGKTLSSQIGSLWLRHILQIHSGLLISNPELPELLGTALGSIEIRLELLSPLARLKGRIDLLLPQVGHSSQDSGQDDEPLFTYNDKDSDGSESDDIQLDINSESENEWEEDDEDGDDDNEPEYVENNIESDDSESSE